MRSFGRPIPAPYLDPDDGFREPAPSEREPAVPARSRALALRGWCLPDGTVRGRGTPVPRRRGSGGASTLIRVEQHEYGPRVYVLGQRIHEFALGIASDYFNLLAQKDSVSLSADTFLIFEDLIYLDGEHGFRRLGYFKSNVRAI